MGKSKNRSLKLGLFVAVGLLLFSVAIYYLGAKQNLFSSSVKVKAYFHDVRGLMEGNKVQYSGITVGFVSDIEIVQDTTILVEVSIEENVAKFIKSDSKVEIKTDGLMGSKIVSISPGTMEAGVVSENDELQTRQSIELQDVLKKAQEIVNETGKVTASLQQITDKINNGNGDLAKLLNENTLTTKFSQIENQVLDITTSTKEVVNTANHLVEKIDRGEGDLGRLINDTVFTADLSAAMENIEKVTLKTDAIAGELEQFTNELNSGNGILTRLVYDTAMANQIDTSIVKISNSVDDIKGAANTIERSWIFNLFSKKN